MERIADLRIDDGNCPGLLDRWMVEWWDFAIAGLDRRIEDGTGGLTGDAARQAIRNQHSSIRHIPILNPPSSILNLPAAVATAADGYLLPAGLAPPPNQ